MVDDHHVDEPQLRRGYYTLQTDGSMGSSGHRAKGDPPGEAGIGVVLKDSNDAVVKTDSRAIGPATNDVAEYEALIAGLELAHGLGIDRIRVYMDSEFIVDQMSGLSDINEADLKLLHEKAFGLFGRFSSRRISWIPREWNREADKLASEARQQRGSPN
jgi:ribonuclease HI